MPSVGDQIKKQREEIFDSASEDLEVKFNNLKHAIEIADSIKKILNLIKSSNIAIATELALDATLFAAAVKQENFDEVKRLLLQGMKRWKDETLKWSKADDLDTTTLTGHPMRTPSLGGHSRGRR